MIRRAFWLAVGAAGGIMGYRRVARLGRRVSGARGDVAKRQGWVLGTIRAAREARGFSRDVREGMELYSARRPRALAPTLPQDNDVNVNVKDDR